jgi:5'-nucleotidase
MSKPLLLISNDDGINAPGLRKLREALRDLGEVIVVAPDAERSAISHAITIATPLRVQEVYQGDDFYGYAVNGTPADCVKLGIAKLLPRRPDAVISGINAGENTAMNVLYSGTVAAAAEGLLHGIPAVAVSLASYHFRDFSAAQDIARKLVQEILQHGLPEGTLLNVNIPPLPRSEIKGVRVARHGSGRYAGAFAEREDPAGRKYYWLTGKREMPRHAPLDDDVLVNAGYAAISPIRFQLTDETLMADIQSWESIRSDA